MALAKPSLTFKYVAMNSSNDTGEDWIDADIRALNLSYLEKSGMQVFRNYKRSFEKEAVRRFKQSLELESLDTSHLEKL